LKDSYTGKASDFENRTLWRERENMNVKSKENIDGTIRYHLEGLLSLFKENPEKVLKVVKEEFKPLTDIFNFDFLNDGNDLNDKREVYNHISEFIGRFVSKPRHVLLYITHQLCNETDSILLNETRLSNEEAGEAAAILPKVKDLIIAVKVNYERPSEKPKEAIIRKTEVWHLKNGSPANFSVEVKINWEDLPADVREEYIKTRERKITFKLYPKE
jgi:hypothetical protein